MFMSAYFILFTVFCAEYLKIDVIPRDQVSKVLFYLFIYFGYSMTSVLIQTL